MRNVFYVLLAGVFWGVISIFFNNLQKIGFNTFQCVALRLGFAALLLFIIIIIKDRNLLKLKPKDLPIVIGMGLCLIGSSLFYLWDIDIVGSSAVPALLLDTAPIFVFVLSVVFLKEKITYVKVIALVLTIIGVLLVTEVFNTTSAITFTAILVGLSAGISYAVYSIINKKSIEKYDSLTLTFYGFLIASIVYIPFSGIFGNLALLLDIKSIAFSLALSGISCVLPFVLYSIALKKLPASKVSIFANIELVVAAVVGIVYFNDKFSVSKIIGFVVVIVAIVLLNLKIGEPKEDAKIKKEEIEKN